MSDSLFDTKFTEKHEQQSDDAAIALPPLDSENTSALINYRVLVSAKEAGALIGQGGQVIDSIRADTNTKAGISRLLPGSDERILTVTGTLDNSSKALSYFAQALVNSGSKTQEAYQHFPLKQLSSKPNVENETTILRLLVPNNQMGTILGSKGSRIQKIQSDYDISIIASKSFLPSSNERLVELQGSVNNLYDSLRIISRCLIQDFSSQVGTKYYTPRGYNNNTARLGYDGGESRSSGPRNSITIEFPNEIVGALIGKGGSRIQGVRKITGATIAISDEVEGKLERTFTILGTQNSIEKAKKLLYQNLEREEQKRKEQEEQESQETYD